MTATKKVVITAVLGALVAGGGAMYLWHRKREQHRSKRHTWRVEIRQFKLPPEQVWFSPPKLLPPGKYQPGSYTQVVNEVSDMTGVYIPPDVAEAFDAAFEVNMTEQMAARGATAARELQQYRDTGLSNGRPLRLQVMVLPPNQRFRVHAHPNLEMECTLTGALYEVRANMTVDTASLKFDPAAQQKSDPTVHIKGPALPADMKFHDAVVRVGEYLANEAGSVHQSYTRSEGCVGLVLWSGCHANIAPEDCKDCIDSHRFGPAGAYQPQAK